MAPLRWVCGAVPHPSEIPTQLGAYTLIEPLGQGAQATVWLAHDSNGREYAIKVKRSGDPVMDRSFLREFESMRLLRVPGVVMVHDAGIEGDLLWFAMDRVQGRPFHEALLEEPYLPDRVDRTVALGCELLYTLARLHEAGFVHRDIKPPNVLVDQTGGVHLLDFGIGQYFDRTGNLAREEAIVGTLPFMAPEQLGNVPTDEKADLFAVGLMLYESISGPREPPPHPLGWVTRICLERLPSLATQARAVPLALSHLIDQLLAVDPADRPSARQAARMMDRIAAGKGTAEQPQPAFIDPGRWWKKLESCLEPDGVHVQILEGESGSGRARIAEQLHRSALLDHVWTLHLHCRTDEVGGPLIELLGRLSTAFDEEGLSELLGDDGAILRAQWPQLALPVHKDGSERPTTVEAGDVTGAIVRVLGRLSERLPLLLIIHGLERVDPLTAQWIVAISSTAGDRLGLLLIVDPRWHGRHSRHITRKLQRRQSVTRVTVPRLSARLARRIATSLCPEAPPPPLQGGLSPTLAVEAGLKALARWRGDPWHEVQPTWWPLAVRATPVPTSVYRALVGQSATPPLVRQSPSGFTLQTQSAMRSARARLSNLPRSAQLIAERWAKTMPTGTGAQDLAALWLLAGYPDRSRACAALAAIECVRLGQFVEARRWILLHDAHPESNIRPSSFAFVQARAEVALRTETTQNPALIDAALEVAATPAQECQVDRLRTEAAIRQGQTRSALVGALALASRASVSHPATAARARLQSARCRLSLGQLTEAVKELQRAEEMAAQANDPILEVQLTDWRAELALASNDHMWCQAQCQRTLRLAAETGYTLGTGLAAHRLGKLLRQLGRRRRAERLARAARDAFGRIGDMALASATDLSLTTLMVERGELVFAGALLDQTIRQIRVLRLDALLPTAMRVALQLATSRIDVNAARMALDTLHNLPHSDPESSAAEVRWWRTRGEADRAIAVVGPESGYAGVLWRTERARAMLAAGDHDACATEAAEVRADAEAAGYGELTAHASLLLGATGHLDPTSWRDELARATTSLSVEVTLGALELEARRLESNGDPRARTYWQTLRVRALELGYRPGVEEADGWLLRSDPDPLSSPPNTHEPPAR